MVPGKFYHNLDEAELALLRGYNYLINFKPTRLTAAGAKNISLDSDGRYVPMKVLAINSSPKMDKGNTALILNPFLEGMREAGADVDILYTKKLKINPCQGCFNCWFKTPGHCFQKDDMEMVREKYRDADIVVYATPLYVDGMAGPLKNLLDRLIPGAQPFIMLKDGHSRHVPHEGFRYGRKVVLVSTCGFWEMDNFEPLLVHMKALCANMGREFAGALLRPCGPVLGLGPVFGIKRPFDDIFRAAKEAGQQLIRDGKISQRTLEIVSRELMPREEYIDNANRIFKQMLDSVKKIQG